MTSLRLVAAGLTVAVALGAGATASSAAPAPPGPGPERAAAHVPGAASDARLDARRPRAWVVLANRLKKGDRQFTRMVRRVSVCAAATPKVRTAKRVRAVAVRGWTRASVRRLRLKNRQMRVAALRVAKAGASCGLATSGSAGSPFVVTPGGGNVITVPVPGAPGAPGAPAQPGEPSATSISVNLPVRTILDGVPIDLSAVLTTGALPQVIRLVPASELTSPLCTAVGTACVGVNATTLASVLTTVASGIPLAGPVLATVTATLAHGSLATVLKVERVSDTVVRIVPIGSLATLRLLLGSLAGAPTATVAVLTTVG